MYVCVNEYGLKFLLILQLLFIIKKYSVYTVIKLGVQLHELRNFKADSQSVISIGMSEHSY